MKTTGISIIIIGIGLVILTTFTSFAREKSTEIKKYEMTGNIPQGFLWYPLVGIGVLGIGALVLRRAA